MKQVANKKNKKKLNKIAKEDIDS